METFIIKALQLMLALALLVLVHEFGHYFFSRVFGVKVEKVNTVTTQGKLKRMGRYEGRTSTVMKAYVILKKDSKAIEFFENMA